MLVHGDLRQYVIFDRLGSTLTTHVVTGSNRRPVGRIGHTLWFRTGANWIDTNAARLLKA